MHHEHGLILTDAAARIAAWCRQDVPPASMAAPLAVLARAYAASRGALAGEGQETIKAVFGITMLGIDVDLAAAGAAPRDVLRRDADHVLAASLFLRKLDIAIAMPVAVAAAGGVGRQAVGMLIGRIADAATRGPGFDPFDEAHLAAFVRELVAKGMALRPGGSAAWLAATLAAALERIAGATRMETVAAARTAALAELGLAGGRAV